MDLANLLIYYNDILFFAINNPTDPRSKSVNGMPFRTDLAAPTRMRSVRGSVRGDGVSLDCDSVNVSVN